MAFQAFNDIGDEGIAVFVVAIKYNMVISSVHTHFIPFMGWLNTCRYRWDFPRAVGFVRFFAVPAGIVPLPRHPINGWYCWQVMVGICKMLKVVSIACRDPDTKVVFVTTHGPFTVFYPLVMTNIAMESHHL